MAPVARGLADEFRVLEPFQRGSEATPLTVARHVEDLATLLDTHCSGERPALIGSSWGAMLALVFAAEHPERTGPVVLIGSGTFDLESRAFMKCRLADAGAEVQAELARIEATDDHPDTKLAAKATAILPVYSYDLVTTDLECEPVDARANRETWDDMLRLQAEEVYPQRFDRIRVPVLMLHGAVDPHPGAMTRDTLRRFIPQLEYLEWKRCGHYPWLERHAREAFFDTLHDWLRSHAG